MRPVLFSTVAIAAILPFTAAQAQVTQAVTAASVSELVITANRSPRPADRIGQSVTVLDAQTIRASQAVAVSDLLVQTPGVSFSRNGGVGGVTGVRVRGAEADQTLLIVDGVKLNDPAATGSGYNFANLLVGDIARIEVLRGAQSTLWGSQAIGGVVNVVTAQATRPFQADIQAEGGAMNTAWVRGGIGGTSDRVDWRLAASRYRTDGVSAYRLGAERDGYAHTGASGRATVRVAESLSLDLRGTYSKGRNDFDGFPAPLFAFADTAEYGRARDLTGYAGVTLDLLGGALKNRAGYAASRSDLDQYNPAQAVTPATFDATGSNRRWEYQGVWTLSPAWTATFGAESERSRMRSASPSAFNATPAPARARVGVDSAYAQAQGQVAKGLTVTAGIRHDDHDAFGGHTLGQIDGAWSIADGATVVRASLGEGFKAPSLYQLYSIYGNAGLAAEEAKGWDIGVTQKLLGERLEVSATAFGRRTRNQIDFVSCAATSIDLLCAVNGVRRFGFYANTARTKAQGVELEGSAALGPLSVRANYTYTRARNATPGAAVRGNQLVRRPEHQANVWTTYTWANDVSLTGAIRYVGASFDNLANTTVLQSYTLLDLRAAWPVTNEIEVYGRIENVFDDDYETVRNYGAPGRGAYVGARARF